MLYFIYSRSFVYGVIIVANTQMDLNNIIKMVKKYTFDVSKQLQHYTQIQTGKGVFTQTKFEPLQEQIQQLSSSSDQNNQKINLQSQQSHQQGQFYLQQAFQQPQSSIKTYQFNSCMYAPTKIVEKVEQSSPDIQIQVQQFLGFNCKQKRSCVLVDQNCYCIALGCNIIFVPIKKQQSAKYYKMFQQHSFDICTLSYSSKYKILLSGSKGLRPEIIAWSVKYEQDKPEQFSNININFINKFRLPRKSQGIGFVKLISESKFICTDSISMHRNNSVYFFDLDAGNQYKSAKKLQAKVYEFIFNQGSKTLYLVTNKGIIQAKNIQQNSQIQIKCIYEGTNQLCSIQMINNKFIIGNRNGSISLLPEKGNIITKKQIHKGWVFNIVVIVQKMLLISCGAEDNLVKIHKMTLNQKQFNLQTVQKLQFQSYCTTINFLNEQNIIMAFRNGSIVVYDCKNKNKKYQKLSKVSYIQRLDPNFFIYSKMNERVIFRLNKNMMIQILPEKSSSKTKNNYILTSFNRQPRCIWIQRDKIISLFCLKDRKYRFQIKNLTQIESQPQKQGNIQIQKQGKPNLIRFNEQIVVLGTKQGHIIIFYINKSVTIASTQKHMSKVQDIIFQEGQFKLNQPFYIKSVSKSQLFYWQIDLSAQQPKLTRITKPGPVKNLTWCSLCKYGWQTRNVWEQMTHFDDIDSFAIVDRKYLCAAMTNGVLRIYRFPPTRNNFIEHKIFPGRFKILSSQKRTNLLICERNCQILLLKFKNTQN